MFKTSWRATVLHRFALIVGALGTAVPAASAATLPGTPATARLFNFDFTSPLATSPWGPASPPPYSLAYLATGGVSFAAGAEMVIDLFADLDGRNHVGTYTLMPGWSVTLSPEVADDGKFSAAYHAQGGTITYDQFWAVGFTFTTPNFVAGVAVVPEPGSALLFALGAAALIARRVGRRAVSA